MPGLTRFNRKAALLLEKLKEEKLTGSDEEWTSGNTYIKPIGAKLNTIRYWRTTETPYKNLQKASDGIKAIFNISDDRNLLSDAVSVKEFSRLLGYNVQRGREIIDQAYSELYPTYSIFYSPQSTADELLKRFQGLHLVYRVESGDRVKEYTGYEGNIIQMPLTIRYRLKGTKRTIYDLFRVRCKLTVPSYAVNTKFFEYDGYITPQKHETHYWLFENRSDENKDLLFMITDSLRIISRHDAGKYAQGVMITRRQDDQPTHKVWKVILLKVEQNDRRFFDPDDTSDPESKFMTDQCKILSKDEVPSWVTDKLEEGWKAIDLSSIPR